jgi:hypothetical protein
MKTIGLGEVKLPDPETQRSYENAYRRGLHHGVALADELAADAATLGDIRRLLRRAYRLCFDYRDQNKHKGRPPLMDELRRKLAKPTARTRGKAIPS